jgi:dihydrodiol dehydrogenase / D-xylose 1-dehydrogenase (NADP)
MTDTLRWGIMSTGTIARAFARGIASLDNAQVVAVGSRKQATADDFADDFDIPHRHDSYEALVNDDEVDVIYIGTPHVFHKENMRLALNAGKHVLCEKPFTINQAEAQTCIDLAREKDLFLMEALWTRYLPAVVQLRRWLADGLIGEVLLTTAHLNVELDPDPQGRIYNLDLGGGALLDVGIYPITFATMVMGYPDTVTSHARFASTGVDEQNSLLFAYENGRSALLSSGVGANHPVEATIKGSKGYIRIHENFHHPTQITIAFDGKDAITHHIPYQSSGLNYEADEVHQCLQAGKRESEHRTLDDTLQTMALMDHIRTTWGLVYPTE